MSSQKLASNFPLRAVGGDQLDLDACKARLEDIGARLKLGKLTEAEADAARLALLARPRSSRRWGGFDLLDTAGALIVPAAVFLFIAGVGVAATYMEDRPNAASLEATNAIAQSQDGPDDELLTRLKDYASSAETVAPVATAAAGKMPDVKTMIERLAARLETTPGDIEGWRMLGRSYFYTARYDEAAAAFARAVELDPNSADLKTSYDEAKVKASEGGNVTMAAASQTGSTDNSGEAMPSPEHGFEVRSMVDGLARRLETSPRDVDGWTSLMRSRVVLGEKEVAETAMRQALEVFKDDQAASGRIAAAATALGLEAK